MTEDDESTLLPRQAVDAKDVVAFWQKEVHYYEGRAGEQGASANRIITLAGGAVVVVTVVSTIAPDQDRSRYLLLIPLIVLLLWATAVRLLHEMILLRAYREHAERRLAAVIAQSDGIQGYRAWHKLGSRLDTPPVITLAWLAPLLALSIGGTYGVIYLLWPSLGDLAWISVAVISCIAGMLIFTLRSATGHARQLEQALDADSGSGQPLTIAEQP